MNQADVAEAIREVVMAAEDDASGAYGFVEVSGDPIDTTGHMSDFFVRVDGREFRIRVTEVHR